MIKSNQIHNIEIDKEGLRILSQNITEGVILVDLGLEILLINDNASSLLGFNNIMLKGNKLQDILPDLVSKDLMFIITRFLEMATHSTPNLESLITNVYLNNKTIQVSLSPIIDANQNILIGILLICQNYEQKNSNKLKAQFMANVSHELRTPLFNIQSFLETLLEYQDNLSDQQKIDFLNIANSETLRLTRLVNNILDLSKLESGHQYQFEVITVRPIIQQVLKSYQLTAQEKGIRLSLSMDNDFYMILGNYDLLFQVFSNLIDNALKFSTSSGTIIVRIFACNPKKRSYLRFFEYTPLNNLIRVEVSDNGTGIAKTKRKFLLNNLKNLDESFLSLRKIGLGLSIVDNIIRRHDSSLHFKSNLDAGTTFWFDLKQLDP